MKIMSKGLELLWLTSLYNLQERKLSLISHYFAFRTHLSLQRVQLVDVTDELFVKVLGGKHRVQDLRSAGLQPVLLRPQQQAKI